MVELSGSLEDVLKAIADPVRRGMLAKLKEGPARIGEIAKPYDMSFAGAAKHLSILVDANLVRKTKVGRSQVCSLNAEPLKALQDWLDEYSKFWNGRLDALAVAIEEFENGQ
tara:strand:+ start:591 stop:926 length:336 start_codon:yes stop_codon:yes gene_type:complete